MAGLGFMLPHLSVEDIIVSVSTNDEIQHEHDHDSQEEPIRRLRFALILLTVTVVAEVIGGILTHSLALLADAGHVFMDLFAMGISLLAARLARQPATAVRTYGWHRAEILAALINGVLLTGLALSLFMGAAKRIQEPREILSGPMLIVAVIGLAVNVVIALKLHGHHAGDLNVRSAYLHVLGDTGASVGVIAAGVVISFTQWYVVDGIVSIGIGLLILVGGLRLIGKAGHILLEGVPGTISLDAVAEAIRNVEGVNSVHDVHIWSVCSHIVSLSCHINIDPKTPEHHDGVIRRVTEMLWENFCIMHPTIQVEYRICGNDIVSQDMKH